VFARGGRRFEPPNSLGAVTEHFFHREADAAVMLLALAAAVAFVAHAVDPTPVDAAT
jgi:hypothetical protein